ncbi:MAG: sulfotransferase [Solirubrobacteraceae bacterium]
MTRGPVLFINGLHRSGTTVLTSAVTEAAGGVTTTVGVLARHIPTLATYLESSARATDRGVDPLQITPDTTEEYGFLIYHSTGGKRALYDRPTGVPLLRDHIAELADEAPQATIVLKNPWDVGFEAQMLADFPDARIIIVRRRLADIEHSFARALARARRSAYQRALHGDTDDYERTQGALASRWRRRLLLRTFQLLRRWRLYGLTNTVKDLPADRVAFLSYDELRADPQRGAQWASHILDPGALAEAFSKHLFAERSQRAPSSLVQRALDQRWRRAWDSARAAQVRGGIVVPPASRLPEPHAGAGGVMALTSSAGTSEL